MFVEAQRSKSNHKFRKKSERKNNPLPLLQADWEIMIELNSQRLAHQTESKLEILQKYFKSQIHSLRSI